MAGKFYERSGADLKLQLRVTANASRDSIGGVWRGPGNALRLIVRVTAPADNGRANVAVIRLAAKTLGLSKSSVTIAASEKDRMKTLLLSMKNEGEDTTLSAKIDNLAGEAV